MREYGFSVIVFEKEAEQGGVWAITCDINIVMHNTRLYCLSNINGYCISAGINGVILPVKTTSQHGLILPKSAA